MPIRLSGIDDGRTQYGIGSYMMSADRTREGSAGDRSSVANYHNRRYNFETLELAGNAPGIDVPIIGNSPSDFPSQQGPLDIINGFTLPGYVESLEPFYRQLVNDERELDPASTNPPSLTSDQSGGRDARVAADGVVSSGALPTSRSAAQPTFTQPPDGVPIRLAVDPSASFTGTVTLEGTDYSNIPITEVLTFDGADALVTTRFFKTITHIYASGAVTATVGGSAEAKDRRYVAIFRENAGGRLLFGMDIYARKGSVPNTYREVYMDGLSFSFSRDGSISLAFTAVGKRPQTNTFVDGTGYNQMPEPADSPPGTVAPHSYRLARRQAFVGWQSGLLFGPDASRQRLALIDATFTLANNILFSPTITGRRHPGGAYRNRRNVTLEGTMEYRSEDNNLMNDVLGNEFLENVALEQVNVTTGGFPYKTLYQFGRLQFVNLPDAPVSEEGIISRPVSMKAVESEDGTRPDVSIRIETIETKNSDGTFVDLLPLAEIDLTT